MTDQTIEPRSVPLGGLRGLEVDRTLPVMGLPTIGPWCFLDQFGPTFQSMEVLPHPHTGLQTVSWLFSGEIEHRDSLGNVAKIKRGQLSLMTAGDGISHSEFSLDSFRSMHGLQFWIALPETRRHLEPAYQFIEELPITRQRGWEATVFMGEYQGTSSPAEVYSPIVGAQIDCGVGRHRIPLNPDFEHGVLAVDTSMDVDGLRVSKRALRFVPKGRDFVEVDAPARSTIVLFGGEPWEDPLIVWWNFVGRTHDEIAEARHDWATAAPRFGSVEGHDGYVIPAPPLPPVRLKPRKRRLP